MADKMVDMRVGTMAGMRVDKRVDRRVGMMADKKVGKRAGKKVDKRADKMAGKGPRRQIRPQGLVWKQSGPLQAPCSALVSSPCSRGMM